MREENTDKRSSPRRSGAHAAAPERPVRSRKAPARRPETGAEGNRAARQAEAERKAAQKTAKAEARAAKKEEKARRAELGKAQRKKALRRLQIAGFCLLFLAILLLSGGAIGGHAVTNNGVNFPKVMIGSLPVGGLSYEETLAALEESGWDEAAAAALRVTPPADVSFKVDLCDAGAMLTKEAAAAAAFRYGHDGNWFSNLFRYVKNTFVAVDVAENRLNLDQDYIRQRAQSGVDKFLRNTAAGVEPYTVDKEAEQLTMVKGAGELGINLDALCSQISSALLDGAKTLDYTQIECDLQMPDFEAIHAELSREPQDASFANAEFDVIDEVVGCDFDVQEAQNLWQAAGPGEDIAIPLSITYPEITGEELRSMLFRDRLGSQTTSYSGSTDARINNIHLAVSKINDVVLMPGEQFSYNEVVGERTTEAGFQAADAYNDGEVVQEIGGGICQVSSTLYCATMYAQLETVERTNHYFKVGYLPYSMDATVSWGGPEFIFRNNRDYPVKIVAYCNDDTRELTIEIWGTDVDGTYVELSHETYMIYDEEYPDVVIGYAVQGYRTVYDKDGNYLEKRKGPYDIYHGHDYDIAWPEEKTNPPDEGGGDSGGGDGSGDLYAPPDPPEPVEPEIPQEPDPYA